MSNPAMVGSSNREQRSTPLLRTMLGEVLRRTRREQGRTLADVARVARVSMAYLSELERGRKEASSEVLAAICDALRIELSEVLAEVGRDLVGHRARASALQTSIVRTSRVQTSAVQTSAVQTSIVQLDAARRRRTSPQARWSGDVQCMLAA